MSMMRENDPFVAEKGRIMKEKTVQTFLASPFSVGTLALALSPEGAQPTLISIFREKSQSTPEGGQLGTKKREGRPF